MTLNPKLDPSCVLCLPFEEANGSVAYDQSLYGNNGTIYGATRTLGKLRKGIYLDGVDDYIDCGSRASLHIRDAITIVAWAKIAVLDNKYRPIVDVAPHYPLKLTDDNKIRFQVYTINGINAVFYSNPQVGVWYSLALTYDKNDAVNGLIAYVNGARVGNNNSFSGQLADITSSWKISSPSSPPNYPFNGIIDEVRIYNRALSAKEIYEHYVYGIQSLRRPRLPKFRKEIRRKLWPEISV